MSEYRRAALLFFILASFGAVVDVMWMFLAALLSNFLGIPYVLILLGVPAICFGYFLCLQVVRNTGAKP